MARLTVLVTGAGALLGQGILRALRASGLSLRIVTGDPDPRAAGHWLGDLALLLPFAVAPEYLARVDRIIQQERIDIVLIGTDVELGSLSAARAELEARHEVRIVVSAPPVVAIADDKWFTAQFLEQHGFPFARSALASDAPAVRQLVEDLGFPLFAKPRRGARSIGARILRDLQDVDAALGEPGLVIQELLPVDNGEYTAGCLVLEGRCSGVVVLRRDLRDGNTYRAYHDEACARFDPFIVRVAEALGPYGPCNFQFRVRGGEPVVFEINCRFSGTTPLRALFGFNEVEHLVRHIVDGCPIPAVRLRHGMALRTTSDLLIDADQLAHFAREGSLIAPSAETLDFLTRRQP